MKNLSTALRIVGAAAVTVIFLLTLNKCEPVPAPCPMENQPLTVPGEVGGPVTNGGGDQTPTAAVEEGSSTKDPAKDPAKDPKVDCPGKSGLPTKAAEDELAATVEEKADGKLTSIVFLSSSKACRCVANRCKAATTALAAAMDQHPAAPEIERLDHSSSDDAERVKALLEQHPAMMLPVLFLIDDQGGLLEKLEGTFDEAKINATLDAHLGG